MSDQRRRSPLMFVLTGAAGLSLLFLLAFLRPTTQPVDEREAPAEANAPSAAPGSADTNRQTPAQRLAAMAEAEVSDILQDRIMRSDQSCQGITRLFHAWTDPKTGDDFWDVMCEVGASYRIWFRNDERGSVSVDECALYTSPGDAPCFEPVKR